MKTESIFVASTAMHNVVKPNLPVSLLLITHNEIGNALLRAATNTLGRLPIPTRVVSIDYKTDPEKIIPELKEIVQQVTRNHSLLILTDLFGSTPSNIAQTLQDFANVRVVAGLNLPMLIRVMNYSQLTLEQLVEKALSGGKDGVCCCEKRDASTIHDNSKDTH